MPKRISLSARTLFLAVLSFISAIPVIAQNAAPAQDVLIEDIEVRGNRRIPRESILYFMQSKPGDRYNPDLARRDLEAIVGQGWFDPLQTKLLTDQGPRGGIVLIFQVREYPMHA